MQHLEVSGAARPLKWSLGVKWLIYGSTWKHNRNKIWAFVHTFGADEEHLSTFGCHWDDLLLGLT